MLVGALWLSLRQGRTWPPGYLATLFLVDFQFNNGFRFGFVHALLGVLIGAAARRDPVVRTQVADPE